MGNPQGTGPKITGSAIALDLDSLIAASNLDPKPIRLFGKEWLIRRDLTPNESVQWLRYMRADSVTVEVGGEDTEVPGEAAAWGILLADMAKGQEINEALENIPREHVRIIANEVIRMAGLADLVGLGEAPAS